MSSTKTALSKESSDTNDATGPKVLIAGAGIGGLTLAILLERAGIQYEVYERAKTIKPLGAAMSLGPSVMPVLQQLGVYEDLLKISKPMMSMDLFQERYSEDSARSVAAPMSTIDFKVQLERSGYPLLIFPRPRLFDVLLDRVPAHKIHMGKKVTEVVQSGDSPLVQIRFADGTAASGDILVGADGAYSSVRQSIYSQANAKDALPKEDLEELTLGYVTMVGTTDALDPLVFPEILDEKCHHLRTVGENKPYTWSTFSCRDSRIAWSINMHVSSPQEKSLARSAEWSPESTQAIIDNVRTFPIPAGQNGSAVKILASLPEDEVTEDGERVRTLTLSDIIDKTPKDGISKVFLDEKLFETWFHGRTVLVGDGAVNALQDAVVLANRLYDLAGEYSDDKAPTQKSITLAFQEYRDERYPQAKLQYQGSKDVAKVLQGQSWIDILIRKFTLTFMAKRFEKAQNTRGLDYMPQATFLPPIKYCGTGEVQSQRPSKRAPLAVQN
ncbi:hypothetical protein BGZ83_008855 [Gryganskiella cystojenkinii]|nr:hypothetical protein BGZ83_008855 [Gryganskiella cystojenkinii]